MLPLVHTFCSFQISTWDMKFNNAISTLSQGVSIEGTLNSGNANASVIIAIRSLQCTGRQLVVNLG